MQTPPTVRSGSFELVVHYVNGQYQVFEIATSDGSIATTAQDVRMSLRRFLQENWWTINTSDRTYFINPTNVLNLELRPPATLLEGEGVLQAVQASDILR
uniref:Uncharacterized protein n=1 Tax=Desertifilum tharense IPPAS B-1220 TaxID=1781255 RepID=A0ACD5GNX2_9CYAN